MVVRNISANWWAFNENIVVGAYHDTDGEEHFFRTKGLEATSTEGLFIATDRTNGTVFFLWKEQEVTDESHPSIKDWDLLNLSVQGTYLALKVGQILDYRPTKYGKSPETILSGKLYQPFGKPKWFIKQSYEVRPLKAMNVAALLPCGSITIAIDSGSHVYRLIGDPTDISEAIKHATEIEPVRKAQ